MADKFGADHRQLIRDTNAGKLEPKDAAHVSTTMTGSTAGITYASNRNYEAETSKAVSALMQNVAQRLGKHIQTKEYSEGFAQGTFEGYKELRDNQSTLSKILFGPSSRLRGAQARILKDSTEQNFLGNYKELENDSKYLSNEQYHEKLAVQMQKEVEKFAGDEEMQKLVTENYINNASSLARAHTTKRQIWIDAENKRSVRDNITTSSVVLNELINGGADPKTIDEAEAKLVKTFQRPEGMHPVVWSTTTADALIKTLQRNNEKALVVADDQGLLDKLNPDDRQRVMDAAEIWKERNDQNYFAQVQSLQEMSINGDTGRHELARSLAATNPTFDLNQWREDDRKLELVRIQEAQERQQRLGWLVSNDSRGQSMSTKDKLDAFADYVEQQSEYGVMRDRELALQAAAERGETLDIDPDGPISYSERANWLLDHPESVLPVWKASQQTYPQLEQSLSNINMLIAAPELTQADLDTLGRQMDFANQFKDSDEVLFNKHFKSDSEMDRFAAYDYLVNKAGVPPKSALLSLRAISKFSQANKDEPVPENLVEDGVDDVVDSFTDKKGEKFLWIFDKSMQNEDQFSMLAEEYYREAYKLYRNHDMATHAARARMLRSGSVIGNKFVPGGAVLDKNAYGGKVSDFLEGWDNDPRFKQGPWVDAGFNEDDSIYDDNITIMPSPDGRQIVITKPSDVNGIPIYVEVPVPQRPEDFSTVEGRKDYFIESFMEGSGVAPVGRSIERIINKYK